MPDIRLTHEEWIQLKDEPAELLKIYVGIRQKADYVTRVAGLGKGGRLNEAYFWQLLMPPAKQGRHKPPTVSRKKVRHCLGRLEALGLLSRKNEVGPLVFFLPMAPTHESAQNKRGRRRANEGPKFFDKKQSTYIIPCSDEGLKRGQHQVSGIRYYSVAAASNNPAREQPVDNSLFAALLDSFPNHKSQLKSGAVQRMLAGWSESARVRPEHISQAVEQICRRAPNLAFGPTYIEAVVFDVANGKRVDNGRPAWARVPMDDGKLWPWAKEHGYPGPGTMTNGQYRAQLRSAVEKRLYAEGMA